MFACLSVRLSATPVWQCSCHRIILKFSGVFTNKRRNVHAKGQGQASKIKVTGHDPIEPFPDRNSSLNSQVVMKWCTKLDVAYKRCPVVFQGHPSNFEVTRLRISPISTHIVRYRAVTPVWMHQWLWNATQSSMYYRSGALLLLNVTHQISRSRRTKKIANFDPNWAFYFTDGFEWFTKRHVVWKRCHIVSQGHSLIFKVTWVDKIVNFYPNLTFPGCDSSLNSPMDLKWCTKLDVVSKMCLIVF